MVVLVHQALARTQLGCLAQPVPTCTVSSPPSSLVPFPFPTSPFLRPIICSFNPPVCLPSGHLSLSIRDPDKESGTATLRDYIALILFFWCFFFASSHTSTRPSILNCCHIISISSASLTHSTARQGKFTYDTFRPSKIGPAKPTATSPLRRIYH